MKDREKEKEIEIERDTWTKKTKKKYSKGVWGRKTAMQVDRKLITAQKQTTETDYQELRSTALRKIRIGLSPSPVDFAFCTRR